MIRRGFATGLLAALLAAAAVAGALAAATAPAPAAKASASTPPKSPPKSSAKPPTRAPAKPANPEPANPASVASDARTREDGGAYGLALEQLRTLRGLVPEDADLELAIALDEARSNLPDSAWARLNGPVLSAALADTGGPTRWRDYPFQREPFWLNGQYDGWYWYIARARAEVALRLQRWDEALAAARRSVYARPLAGKEHLLLALCLAHAGETAGARLEVARAIRLDPMLPEAHYLGGLLAWSAGDRAGARAAFRAALANDSLYRAPALALSRLLVPGLAPDPLPTNFLSGIRRAAELTSRVRPKLEEYVQYDQLATLYGRPTRAVPESLQRVMGMTRPIRLYVTVLVDERGRVVLNELPWMSPGSFPEELLDQVLRDAARWNFRPAYKLGQPRASLASVEYQLTL